jgi:hypothetical protein
MMRSKWHEEKCGKNKKQPTTRRSTNREGRKEREAMYYII